MFVGAQPTVPSIPGGGYPSTNASGQRICRQCGQPGRYKDGKCVEKWGPGPEGPGTVCDRYAESFPLFNIHTPHFLPQVFFLPLVSSPFVIYSRGLLVAQFEFLAHYEFVFRVAFFAPF